MLIYNSNYPITTQIHMSMKYLLCIVALLLLAHAAPVEDEVQFPISGYNKHKWYSGYLNFTKGQFHYVFFDSQHDPDNDPVLLWLNGGPGCSSLIGMVYENGPFTFKTNTTQFEINDFAWNKRANVIYLESPGGVGFSKGFRSNNNTDNTVAQDNYRALVAFFRKFPNLKKNDFYISGESYAGIYIPYLAQEILTNNRLPERQVTINLKGIMIGNACTDPRECYEPTYDKQQGMSIFQYDFLHKHGYLTDRRHDNIRAACLLGYGSEECRRLRGITDKEFQATKTIINNIYEPCHYQTIPNADLPATSKFTQSRVSEKVDTIEGVQAYTTCEDIIGIQHFFNEPAMHEYLHVDSIKYNLCSDQVADAYKMNDNASEWLYPLLLRERIRIWIFSGDVDANVPVTGTSAWVQRLKESHGLPVDEPWREWWVPGAHKHEDQVGGMVWKLRGFTFVTVKGAGHMVPKDKKKQGQVLFHSFIDGVDLPSKAP